MSEGDELGKWISEYFQGHLFQQQGMSRHTLLSYRDTIKLFLRFAAHRTRKDVVVLSVQDLAAPVVRAFLNDLETTRKCKISTRNQRLAALRSFFRYLGESAPEHLGQCQRVLAIKAKRTPSLCVGYLEPEELEAIFAAIDQSTPLGLRALTLFTFLYNTGARVQEALDLRPTALQLNRPPWVRIIGKGRKTRVCPLWPETVARTRALLASRGLQLHDDSHLFVSRTGTQLTRFGVRYLLAKYVAIASAHVTSLKKKSVHPHTIRHTTAVHMLQAGVELNMIRSWLGHVHIDTTNHYAEINLAMKRRILESARGMASHTKGGRARRRQSRWHTDENLLRWLDDI